MQIINDYFNELDDAWLGLTKKDIREFKFQNPFKEATRLQVEPDAIPLSIMRQPEYISYACKQILNVELMPYQAAVMSVLWNHPFPMFLASRGGSKSFSLAVYSMLKMALTPRNKTGGPGARIVITGAGFRQSKVIFEYMESIWYNAPLLRNIAKLSGKDAGPKKEMDRWAMNIGPNYALCIPVGDGTRIRGLRANIVCCDEFASLNPEIFEEVVQGFANVSSNPVDNVKRRSKYERARQLGLDVQEPVMAKNQIIISGTASYDFEHFSDYWKKYKAIIESRGDYSKLSQYFPDGPPDNFNWKDYCIIRIPFDKLPRNYLDENVIARAQATVHTGTFQKEYGCIFTKDSTGFFPRSLIESAIANNKNVNKMNWPIWCPVAFDPMIHGNKNSEYILGIDPASEKDNFSIVILELNDGHARIVYCATTRKDKHRELIKKGLVNEHDFYEYACRRIRELMKVFPVKRIMLDSQGGGVAVTEALHNKKFLEPGEDLIWPVINPEKPGEFDTEPGQHIIELINFSDSTWVSEANHGLKHDLETRRLLFPQFDSVSLELSAAIDRQRISQFEKNNPGFSIYPYDTHEDCTFEIEELKDELTSIIHTKTSATSRDKWDTPETKTKQGRKGRMRKDRYSALLMANMGARALRKHIVSPIASNIGGLLMEAAGKEGQIYNKFLDEDRRADFERFYKNL